MKREATLTTPKALPELSVAGGKHTEHRQIFSYIDKDGDGIISPVELADTVRSVSEELCPESLMVGLGGGGVLGFDEFVKLIEGEGEEERERSLWEAFRVYEMEGQGCITAQSLRRVLGMPGECKTVEECRVMIGRFDINGDGVISFQEFPAMMQFS